MIKKVVSRFFYFNLFIVLMTGAGYAQKVESDTLLSAMRFDEAPLFKGGVQAWLRFLQQNLNIHKLASTMDSTSYVTYGSRQIAKVQFTVCEDGRVCDVEVINRSDISPEFVNEAIRVMNKSPKWLPGRNEGNPVRVRFVQSITAILSD